MPPEALSEIDWAGLKRLRARFLANDFGGSYWESDALIQSYDVTFAQRIAWKWRAVLNELQSRGWADPPENIFDWGCGTGIASRTVADAFGADKFRQIFLHDSAGAVQSYAERQCRKDFPKLEVRSSSTPPANFLLLVSHVLNELTAAATEELLALVDRADAVIWVESGTSNNGRKLPEFREKWRSRFRILAPCTHQAECGLLTPANAANWCHHFAKMPIAASQSEAWSRFSREMGIDLRRTPYSFVAMEKITADDPFIESVSRVLGEPRHYKGYSKILSCDKVRGVAELTLQKRDAPQLLKELKKPSRSDGPPLYRWQTHGNKIVSGEKQ